MNRRKIQRFKTMKDDPKLVKNRVKELKKNNENPNTSFFDENSSKGHSKNKIPSLNSKHYILYLSLP